jgi:hypothetical protein
MRWGDLGIRNVGTNGNEGTWLHGFNPEITLPSLAVQCFRYKDAKK